MERVLIANRGEIAVRIIHACHDSGRKAIAVYADADANALFVRLADEAYALPGTTPAQTYLNIDAIIAIARKAHADAVHPGYGFLSENTDSAQAVLDAGLVWIGPSPHTIRILGDKVEARRIAAEVGAPMAPRHHRARARSQGGRALRQGARPADRHQSRARRRRTRS